MEENSLCGPVNAISLQNVWCTWLLGPVPTPDHFCTEIRNGEETLEPALPNLPWVAGSGTTWFPDDTSPRQLVGVSDRTRWQLWFGHSHNPGTEQGRSPGTTAYGTSPIARAAVAWRGCHKAETNPCHQGRPMDEISYFLFPKINLCNVEESWDSFPAWLPSK